MHWWMQLSPDKYAFELVNGSENSMKELYLCNFENAKYLKNLQEKTAQQEKHLSTTQITELIVDSIQDIKGKNIVSLDIRELDDAPTDYFIICEGDSSTQISAIANNSVKRLKEEAGLRPSHVEGKQSGTWVLVDYFDVIVHVFYPETRRFYEIEENEVEDLAPILGIDQITGGRAVISGHIVSDNMDIFAANERGPNFLYKNFFDKFFYWTR